MSPDQSAALREIMRERFAVHYTELGSLENEDETENNTTDDEEAPTKGGDDVDIEPGPEW